MRNINISKSCILVPDDGSLGPIYVACIDDDDIKILLCLAVIYMPIILRHKGMDSIKIKMDFPIYHFRKI